MLGSENTVRARLTRTLVWIGVAFGVAGVRGDLHETFESVQPTWQVGSHDCRLRVDRHQRVFGEAHGGQGAEYLSYRVGEGTYARLVHPVLPTRVINELSVSVWVRASRPGPRLLLRVVLPRSIDSQTGRPVIVWLPGSRYQLADRWEMLRLEQCRRRLEERVVALRAERHQRLDWSEAYIDQVVLDLYAGPGETRLWIDDLELRGQVLLATDALPPVGHRVPTQQQPVRRDSPPAAEFRGDLLYLHGKPASLRIIDYHGESFEFLHSAGFNVVAFSQLPTSAEDRALASLGMWWIAPFPVNPGAHEFERLLAWRWPVRLTVRDVDLVRERLERYRRSGGRVPVLAWIDTGMENYSHWMDALVAYRPVMASTTPLSDYTRWLGQIRSLARMDTPLFAAIDSDLPRAVSRQIEAMGGEEVSLLYSGDSLQAVVAAAVQQGIRSFWFRSTRSLQHPDVRSLRRARILTRVNRRLELIEPWLAAGKIVAVADSNLPAVRGVLLQTDYSRLLLATQRGPGIANCPAEFAKMPLTLSVDGIPATDQAFLVRPHGLVRLATRQASSLRVVDPQPGLATLALVTRDPRAIRYVADRLQSHDRGQLRRLRDELRQEWDWTRLTIERMSSWLRTKTNESATGLAGVERQYRYLEQLVRAQDGAQAHRVADQISDRLRRLQRLHWEVAISGLDHPSTSPACVTFYALPIHWQSVKRLWQTRWSANLLPAGEFENLAHMQGSGWRYSVTLDPRVEPRAVVVPAPVFDGRGALQLSARPRDDQAATRDEPAIRIESPAVSVTPGQWIKISGQVRISEPLTDHVDALRISDSLGGVALAQTIRQTGGWTPFVFYRVAPATGEVRVRVELFGNGTVWLDDFRVQVAQP